MPTEKSLFTFKLSKQLHDQLKEVATEEELTVSGFICWTLERIVREKRGEVNTMATPLHVYVSMEGHS